MKFRVVPFGSVWLRQSTPSSEEVLEVPLYGVYLVSKKHRLPIGGRFPLHVCLQKYKPLPVKAAPVLFLSPGASAILVGLLYVW